MAFILQSQSEISAFWPVVIDQPADNGETETSEFQLRFKGCEDSVFKDVSNPSYLANLLRDYQAGNVPLDEMNRLIEERQVAITEFLSEHVVGWKGVEYAPTKKGGKGKPVPFNKDNLTLLLATDKHLNAVFQAYNEFRAGRREKN